MNASNKDIEVKLPSIIHSIKPTDFFKRKSRNKEETFNVTIPKIDKSSTVLTLGSCFAHHVRNALSQLGFKTNELVFYDDEITTTLAMREHFEWLLGDKELRTENIHERSGNRTEQNVSSRLKEFKEKSLATLTKSKCVILTFGLSETWVDTDGRSVWHWPGKDRIRMENLSFKLISSAENQQNIKEIVRLIRTINKDCLIVLTLSPVPLGATFRKDFNVNISNCSSKARIRAALDEFFVENEDGKIFYWPSFEFVTQHENPWEDDGRHVKPSVVEEVMKEFVRIAT